jgi:glycogen debranching enzyme
MHAVLSLVPCDDQGRPVDTEITATPAVLTWNLDGGRIDAVFESNDRVRLRGHGGSIRIADAAKALTPFTGTYLFQDPRTGSAVFTSYETGRRYRVTVLHGDSVVEGAEALGLASREVVVGGDQWEVAIDEFETTPPPPPKAVSFDDSVATVASEFGAFLDAIAPWRSDLTPAADLAAYVLWSATVSPRGFLGRESVLMSKHWMDKVWSWDHCFNALALSALPELAIAQFRTPFDHQEASGALPDSVTHSEVLYNFVKPPIHGWALQKLRAETSVTISAEELAEIYAGLARWTRFWLDARRVIGHALPHYQHGNDSGWDNSTMFDTHRVVEAPDLAAFLVIQLDSLVRLAEELGTGESNVWRILRDETVEALVGELWDGRQFVARGPIDRTASSSTSLLNLMPIVVAGRLDRAIVDRLVDGIAAHLTDWGLATEHPNSPHYEDDGYWRGPIWAPSTVLIEDGLRRAGSIDLADRISERFRRLCESSGFAENFDALKGTGLRDRAYTWTASAYLLLAREATERAS